MVSRKTERSNQYTFFMGGLTEEEQMYKDYYETDIENEQEDEKINEMTDQVALAYSGDFAHKLYDFQEMDLLHDNSEFIDDVVDKKIFKYKYRIANDDL